MNNIKWAFFFVAVLPANFCLSKMSSYQKFENNNDEDDSFEEPVSKVEAEEEKAEHIDFQPQTSVPVNSTVS